MRKINLIFIIGLLLALNSCDDECCDCCGDKYPNFKYQDTYGKDLLSPFNSKGYNIDSIHFEVIQNSTRVKALPELSGGEYLITQNQDTVITPTVLNFNYWLIEGFKIESGITDTLLIHLNAIETDTVVWETYLHPERKYIYTKQISVNGKIHVPDEGGFITIIKDR
ncbi:MAG: hypothetical protein ABJG41_06995 [Cyclobacteriaceae bacterium]